jgi:hypothetical protein
MKPLILLSIFAASCGVKHKVTGTAKTESEVRATVAITFPQCDRPAEPLSEVTKCIEACMRATVTVNGDEKTIELLKDLQALDKQEEAAEPEQIQGGV